MLFLFLFSVISVAPKTNKVESLNYKLFRKNIMNKTKDQTWVVLFYDETNSKQRDVHAQFAKTAALSLELLNFGSVDVKKNVQLAEDCSIYENSLPKIMVYYYKGKTEYVGNKRPDKMSTNLLKFLPKMTKEANYTWKENLLAKKTCVDAAILFANNETVPDFWNAIAGYFAHKQVNIGYTNNKTLFDMFDIGDVPAVIFINQSGQYDYHGKTNFKVLKDAISAFTYGRFQPSESQKTAEIEPFYFSDEFEKECLSHRSYCVIHSSDALNEEYDKIHSDNIGKPYKFFYGSDEWPYNFIEKNSIWIFNPRNNKILRVSDFNELRTILDKIDGEYQWNDVESYNNKEL